MGILDKPVTPTSIGAVSVVNERLSLTDPRINADPTGATVVDTALQAAFDMLRNTHNPTLFVPPGQYKLSRKADVVAGQGYSAAIFKGLVEGAGADSHFFLDPATTAGQNPSRYFPIRIGTQTEATTGPVTFRNLKFTGNNALIAGSSVMGFAARHDDTATVLIHSDDVTVENCTIVDTAVAIGCTKAGNSAGGTQARLDAQFRRWKAINNHILTTSNKAIEFGECTGGWMVNNDIEDAFNGPQSIFYSREQWITGNRVRYRESGINIAQDCDHFYILNNDVAPGPNSVAGGGNPALYLRAEPTSTSTPVLRNGLIQGNSFRNPISNTLMRAMQFGGRTEVTSFLAERLRFIDNTFEGDVLLRDPTAPSKTTIQDIVWRGNRFTKALDTVSQATNLVQRMRFSENEFTLAQTIKGSDWQFRDDIFTAGLTLDAASARIRGTVDAPSATITNSGTGNTVTARALL